VCERYGGVVRFEVTDADIAATLGTGDVPVLATSRLVTWMEATTVQSASQFLKAGQTSVGTAVRIEHRRPTPLGGSVDIVAEASAPEAGRLTFSVRAFDSSGESIGEGEIDRAIVDRTSFLRRATGNAADRASAD
jgi:fluoroacetyl-CoA thioesterase